LRVPSTAVRQIDYDAPRYRLMVTFVSGRAYVYDGVPQDVYDTFRTADSKGAFFNRYIRDRYRYREVKLAG
jgi:hypothetical protein